MIGLLSRAADRYRQDGAKTFIILATVYVIKNFVFEVGSRGLYNREWFINLVVWWNTGFGRYEAVANPYKILWIDPQEIERVSGREPYPGKFQQQDMGKIKSGDWDRNEEKFYDLPRVRTIRERFKNGKKWEKINLCDRIYENCIHEDIIEWQNKVESLYRSIREEGYLSHDELSERYDNSHRWNKKKESVEPYSEKYSEVKVDIGRNGDFLFVNGRHRLAIAQIVGVKRIPVRVVVRHRKWQVVREHYQRSQEPPNEHHTHHPDLLDLP